MIKLDTQGLKCNNLQSDNIFHDFVFLQIF